MYLQTSGPEAEPSTSAMRPDSSDSRSTPEPEPSTSSLQHTTPDAHVAPPAVSSSPRYVARRPAKTIVLSVPPLEKNVFLKNNITYIKLSLICLIYKQHLFAIG